MHNDESDQIDTEGPNHFIGGVNSSKGSNEASVKLLLGKEKSALQFKLDTINCLNKLRVCLDPKDLNHAIMREHLDWLTVDEITSKMTGAKAFSKIDLNHGYWQQALHDDSQLLTTFNTPFGR